MEFGDKLIEQRKKFGFSQEQLADKLGVSRQAISRWESESVLPDSNNLKKISEVFDISIDYLLFDDCIKERDVKVAKNIQKDNEKKLCRVSILLLLFGTIGTMILFILSTQIPAIEMKPLVISDEANIYTNQVEETDIELYVPQKVYSFLPFLKYYNLNIVGALFIVLITMGFILLLYSNKHLLRKDM